MRALKMMEGGDYEGARKSFEEAARLAGEDNFVGRQVAEAGIHESLVKAAKDNAVENKLEALKKDVDGSKAKGDVKAAEKAQKKYDTEVARVREVVGAKEEISRKEAELRSKIATDEEEMAPGAARDELKGLREKLASLEKQRIELGKGIKGKTIGRVVELMAKRANKRVVKIEGARRGVQARAKNMGEVLKNAKAAFEARTERIVKSLAKKMNADRLPEGEEKDAAMAEIREEAQKLAKLRTSEEVDDATMEELGLLRAQVRRARGEVSAELGDRSEVSNIIKEVREENAPQAGEIENIQGIRAMELLDHEGAKKAFEAGLAAAGEENLVGERSRRQGYMKV
jgi:hypothetical protein